MYDAVCLQIRCPDFHHQGFDGIWSTLEHGVIFDGGDDDGDDGGGGEMQVSDQLHSRNPKKNGLNSRTVSYLWIPMKKTMKTHALRRKILNNPYLHGLRVYGL